MAPDEGIDWTSVASKTLVKTWKRANKRAVESPGEFVEPWH